jgi:DNA-binding transcriptional LysR family regulator
MPVMHAHATHAEIELERLDPERIVLLPREVNPAFYDGIVSLCRDAGISPTLVHTLESRVELALLAVSSGAGIAILPESVAGSMTVPGIRFVALAAPEPICESAVLTRADTDDLATHAFVTALARASRRKPLATVESPLQSLPLAAA